MMLKYVVVLSALTLAACYEQKKPTPVPPAGLAGATGENHASTTLLQWPKEQPSQQVKDFVSGVVVESISRSSFTFAQLRLKDKKTVWVALVNTPLKAGQTVTIEKDTELRDFQSKELNRKFDVIIFGRIKQ